MKSQAVFDPFTGSLNYVPVEEAPIEPITYQFQVPALVWNIVGHPFSDRPEVRVFDQNGTQFEVDVTYPTTNSVRVTWGFLMTGSVELRD